MKSQSTKHKAESTKLQNCDRDLNNWGHQMPRFHGDLPDRSYQFALKIATLCDQLPSRTSGWVIGKQLVRSGTSIGANIREADGALTKREFVQFCNIARRESLETEYWLCLCRDRGMLTLGSVEDCIIEAQELSRILATIIVRSRETRSS